MYAACLFVKIIRLSVYAACLFIKIIRLSVYAACLFIKIICLSVYVIRFSENIFFRSIHINSPARPFCCSRSGLFTAILYCVNFLFIERNFIFSISLINWFDHDNLRIMKHNPFPVYKVTFTRLYYLIFYFQFQQLYSFNKYLMFCVIYLTYS